MKKIAEDVQKKFDIPDHALRYDGINCPECGVFVDGRDGAQKLGQVIENTFGGPRQLVVVIDLGTAGFIATKSHNLDDGLTDDVPFRSPKTSPFI